MVFFLILTKTKIYVFHQKLLFQQSLFFLYLALMPKEINYLNLNLEF